MNKFEKKEALHKMKVFLLMGGLILASVVMLFV